MAAQQAVAEALRRWQTGLSAKAKKSGFILVDPVTGTPLGSSSLRSDCVTTCATQVYYASRVRFSAPGRATIPAEAIPVLDIPAVQSPSNDVSDLPVGQEGLEPSANGLRVRCSTIELLAQLRGCFRYQIRWAIVQSPCSGVFF